MSISIYIYIYIDIVYLRVYGIANWIVQYFNIYSIYVYIFPDKCDPLYDMNLCTVCVFTIFIILQKVFKQNEFLPEPPVQFHLPPPHPSDYLPN